MDFAKKTFSIFKMDIGVHSFTFFLKFALAGLLGPYNFGLFSLIMLIPDYSEKLGRLGVDYAAVYWAGKKKYPIGDIIIHVGITTVLLSLIPIFLFLWKGDLFMRWILHDPSTPQVWIWIVLLSIPFIFFIRSVSMLLLFLEKITAYNNITFLPPFFGLLIGVLGIVLLKTGIIGVFIGYSFAYIVAAFIGGIFLIEHITTKPHLKIDIVKDLVNYGTKVYSSNVMEYLQYRVDMLIVSFFLSPKEVGCYALAVTIAEIMRKIPTVSALIFYPRVSKSSHEEAVLMTTKTCRYITALIAFLSIPFYFFVKVLFVFFLKHNYSSSLILILVLLPGLVGVGISPILRYYFFGSGYPNIATKAMFIGLLSNVVANLLLIPRVGVIGAAISSTFSYILCTVVLSIDFFRLEKVKFSELFVLRRNEIGFFYDFFNFVVRRHK